MKFSSLNKVQERVRLQDLETGKTYTLLNVAINPSKYGVEIPCTLKEVEQTVYLPQYLSNDVEQILSDPDAMQELHDGKCGLKIREYQNSYGTYKGVIWEDLD